MVQRIMIVGQPGSGKSTLAQQLGRKTGLPVVHIDHIHWMSGWRERSRDEKSRLCNEVEAGDCWIFEGGHSATWDNRLRRAEVLIWLDIPVALRLWRVFWRTLRFHGRARPDLPEGCPEGFHHETLPFWRFIWRTRQSGRANIERLWSRVPAGKVRVRLASSTQVRRFLREWGADS